MTSYSKLKQTFQSQDQEHCVSRSNGSLFALLSSSLQYSILRVAVTSSKQERSRQPSGCQLEQAIHTQLFACNSILVRYLLRLFFQLYVGEVESSCTASRSKVEEARIRVTECRIIRPVLLPTAAAMGGTVIRLLLLPLRAGKFLLSTKFRRSSNSRIITAIRPSSPWCTTSKSSNSRFRMRLQEDSSSSFRLSNSSTNLSTSTKFLRGSIRRHSSSIPSSSRRPN